MGLWFYVPRRKGNRYVDNNGCTSSIELRNRQAACKYVSKYITKDLDYCNLDVIKKYLDFRTKLSDEKRRYYNKFLPKHFQSKGIGSSLLKSGCTPDLLLDFVKNGVYNPTTCQMDQLPRYYVEKFCFEHKRHLDVDGRVFVVRSLREEYELIIREVVKQSFVYKVHQLSNFYNNININVFKKYGYSLSDYVRFQRLKNSFPEDYFICRSWFDHLTTTCKTIFKTVYNVLSVDNLVDFRVLLYRLEIDKIKNDEFTNDDNVDWFMSVFNTVSRETRAVANVKRYEDYLRVKKLKFIQKKLL